MRAFRSVTSLTPCMTLEDVRKGTEEAARRMAACRATQSAKAAIQRHPLAPRSVRARCSRQLGGLSGLSSRGDAPSPIRI